MLLLLLLLLTRSSGTERGCCCSICSYHHAQGEQSMLRDVLTYGILVLLVLAIGATTKGNA